MPASSHAYGDRYHASIRTVHWLMALGFLFMWGCGYAMTSIVADDSPLQEILFGLHISIGVTLLFLLIVRIAIRLGVGAPPLSPAIPRIERIGAHLGHLGLYALPVLIITAVYKGRRYRRDARYHYGCDEYIEKPVPDRTRGGRAARRPPAWVPNGTGGVRRPGCARRGRTTGCEPLAVGRHRRG